jgi:histone H3/H4
MTQVIEKEEPKAGWEWELELSHHLDDYMTIDPEDEERLDVWVDRLSEIQARLGDKYLAKRITKERAVSQCEYFRKLSKRYADQARKYANLEERMKTVTCRDLEMHLESTGKKKVKLSDGTTITLAERKGLEYLWDGRPVEDWIGYPDQLPFDCLNVKISKSAMAKWFKANGSLPGVQVREIKSTYVRW